MKKTFILIMFFILCITGCGNKVQVEEKKQTAVKQETSKPEIKTEEVDYSRYSGSYTKEILLKQDYIYGTTVDLKISSNNKITGTVCSATENANHIAQIDFSGEIKDNKFTSNFEDDGWGHIGILEIDFEENYINVTLKYTGKTENESSLFGIGEGTFKLINKNTKVNRTLQDLKDGGLMILTDSTFNTKFENYGDVKFISGLKREDGEKFVFYLSDNNDNILYKLPEFPYSQIGFASDINCIAFYDLNKDNKKDILVIASYKTLENENLRRAAVYFQKDKEFVLDKEINDSLNELGYNNRLEDVLEYFKSQSN